MATLWRDLRYAFRTLRRDAGFTTFAILIVGLGIGACSTIFSVVDTLLIRPLPFSDPASLVWIANHSDDGKGGLSSGTVQVNHFRDLRDHNQSFSDLASYNAFYGVGDRKLIGHGEPQRLTGVEVSQNFFPMTSANGTVRKLCSSPTDCGSEYLRAIHPSSAAPSH
jgi:hypothetical protein